jgi:hypothetical protein
MNSFFIDIQYPLCDLPAAAALHRSGRGAGREVSSRGEQGAVRPAVAAGAVGSLLLFFAMAMAMAGAIGGARWRSPPPLS